MTVIDGVETMTAARLIEEIEAGGRFVLYTWCVSPLVMTIQRPTNIKYVGPHESRVGKGLPYGLVTLLLGWWGIPWGPIHSIGSLVRWLRGGNDLTATILQDVDKFFWSSFGTEEEMRKLRNLGLDLALAQD